MLRIRERELTYYTNNCLSISTSAVPPSMRSSPSLLRPLTSFTQRIPIIPLTNPQAPSPTPPNSPTAPTCPLHSCHTLAHSPHRPHLPLLSQLLPLSNPFYHCELQALLAGFAWYGLTEVPFNEKANVFTQTLYLVVTTLIMGLELLTVVNATLCAILGPGLVRPRKPPHRE